MVLSKEYDILGELSNFSLQLKNYEAYRVTLIKQGLTKQQKTEMRSLREKLLRESGKFGTLISELTGKEKIKTIGKGDEYSYDMWAAALRITFNTTTLNALRICIDYTERTIGKLETDINEGVRDKQGKKVGESSERLIESPLQIFDAMQFHPQVVEASRELFEDGHYRDAIYRAFVEVSNFVKRKAKSQLDGRRLMSTVFSPENPMIKLNPLETQTDKDEQEGFMYLFMGAMQGIRNPKAHENIIQNNPHIAVKLIGFASLLIETIAFWKAEDT